uniref:Uncharacterized protein n=1 Tax=Phlebotomus papatasi TaxID=29031 RepID=A0A1B0D7Z8_PHLPP
LLYDNVSPQEALYSDSLELDDFLDEFDPPLINFDEPQKFSDESLIDFSSENLQPQLSTLPVSVCEKWRLKIVQSSPPGLCEVKAESSAHSLTLEQKLEVDAAILALPATTPESFGCTPLVTHHIDTGDHPATFPVATLDWFRELHKYPAETVFIPVFRGVSVAPIIL